MSPHRAKTLVLALPLLCVVAGCCCQALPLPGETGCPTDARRLYVTCGEEAVRRCPCGPDRDFYGLKPTEWRSWPEGWRCNESGWELPPPQVESEPVLADASGLNDPQDERPPESDPQVERKLGNPFSRKAEPKLPLAANADSIQAAEATTIAPAAGNAVPVQFPVLFNPLSVKVPAISEAFAPLTPKTAEAAPAQSVPHVDPSLSDRVQNHLLNNLTL